MPPQTTLALDPSLFAAAIVTVIAALSGAIVAIINAYTAAKDRRDSREERKALLARSEEAAKTADGTARKADELVKQTSEIHAMTNSTNSNLQKALELMTEKHAGLEKLVNEMERTRQNLAAQTTLDRAIAAPAVGAVGGPAGSSAPEVIASLASIDEHSAAIEQNTAAAAKGGPA